MSSTQAKIQANFQAGRLAKQLEATATREEELLTLQKQLAQQAVDQEALNAKLKASMTAQKVQTEKQLELSKQFEEVRQEYQAHVAEDEKLRKELSDSLATQIAELNGRMQTDVGARGQVMEDNARLKEQLKILDENMETTGPKFEELCATREKETNSIQERLAKEMEQEKLLTEKIEEQKQQIPGAQKAYDEIKEKVDIFVEKFQNIQASLQDANKVYTKSREEQERIVKKIQATEKEAIEATKRAERSKLEYSTEVSSMERYEVQLKTLEAQTFKLKCQTATLLGKPLPAAPAGVHVDPVA